MKNIFTLEKIKPLLTMDILDKYLRHSSNLSIYSNPVDFFSFILPFLTNKNHAVFKAIKKLSNSGASYLPKMIKKNLIEGYIQRKKYEQKTGVRISPLLALTPLNDCNLSCEGCFASGYKKGTSIEEGDLRKILHFFQNNGTRFFVILGGEPLMYKNLIKILSEFNQSIFILYTNSTLFNENLFCEIKEARNIIPMISVDGNEETTDGRRGKGVYKKVINTIQKFISEKIPYGVSFTFSKANFDELLSGKYLQTFESDFLIFATYIQFMDMSCSNIMDNNLSPDMQKKAAKIIKEYRSRKSYVIGNIPQDEIDLWGGCPAAGKGILHINANTGVEPCIFTHFSNTNLKELKFNFDEALKNNYLRALRKENCNGCFSQKDYPVFHKISKKFNPQQTEYILGSKAL